MRNMPPRRRIFVAGDTVESRVFCRCEGCRLSFGRLLYPAVGGSPLGFGRLPGFSSNFSAELVRARQRRWRR